MAFNPFSRTFAAAALAGATAFTPLSNDMYALAQDNTVTTSVTPATNNNPAQENMATYEKMAALFRQIGVDNERSVKRDVNWIRKSLSRIYVDYVTTHPLAELQDIALEGMKQRIESPPAKLAAANAAMEAAKAQLAALKARKAEAETAGHLTEEQKTELDLKIEKANVKLDKATNDKEDAVKLQTITADDLKYAAIEHVNSWLDPHSAFVPPKKLALSKGESKDQPGGIGVDLKEDTESHFLKDGAVVKDTWHPEDRTPAFMAGLKKGDVITAIDGKSLKGMTIRHVMKDLLIGKPGTDVTVTIKRPGEDEPLNVTMKRKVIRVAPAYHRIVDGDKCYIQLQTFMTDAAAPFVKDSIESCQKELGGKDNVKAYVLDLRNNGGGRVDQAVKILDMFIDGDQPPQLKDGQLPPESYMRHNTVVTMENHGMMDQRDIIHPGDMTGGKPLDVLVNGGTASASEITSGNLQDYGRATVIGTQTYGKGSAQSVRGGPAAEGQQRTTTARYHYGRGNDKSPFGLSPQNTGITPNIKADFGESSFKEREADHPNTLKAPEGSRSKVKTTLQCLKTDMKIDLKTVDQSLIDPVSKNYDYTLACAINNLRKKIRAESVDSHKGDTQGLPVKIVPYSAPKNTPKP